MASPSSDQALNDRIVFTFEDHGVEVGGRMLLEDAPQTCEAIWNALPVSGLAIHAKHSGSEIFLPLQTLLKLPKEHATTNIGPGDVGFAWFAGGTSYGLDSDVCELCWPYDIDATPSTPEGPETVNVFARLEGELTAFFDICRRMQVEGAKELTIRRG